MKNYKSPAVTLICKSDRLLDDSCYYPASGLDASPVIILNGFIHSFVCVDYSVKRDDYIMVLEQSGFKGYNRILSRDIAKDEVLPPQWMMPLIPPNLHEQVHRILMEARRHCTPFGHWSIWQRHNTCDDRVGPPIFSLFFLAGEGIASFQGLYVWNHIAPKVCALIQPGYGLSVFFHLIG